MTSPDLRNLDPATLFPATLKALRNPAFLKTPKYQEQQKRALREGAHPLILEFSDKFVKRMAGLGVPVFAHSIVRDAVEQAGLYARGVSNDSPTDGLWPHRAFAADHIHGNLAWMDELAKQMPVWEVFGHVGKEVAASMDLKIRWGGDWRTRKFPQGDPAHWELANWREIALKGDKHWSPD